MESDPTAARALMEGVSGRRYLWTDAFAVCNWLGLGEVERARALVEDVHGVLGRHRRDDLRTGWISGLSEEEGARRPTAGGLRIGKPLPERGPDDPYEPQLEWERDGQYYHYLTRWMRALDRTASVTGDDRYRRWAAELGRVAFDRFSHGIGPVPNRLYWKMSIDLSRPLAPSMGQHDPLDGYVSLGEVRAGGGDDGVALSAAVDALAGMVEGSDLATEDPLGAGSLLTDALFLARLAREEEGPEPWRILQRVVQAAGISLREIRDTRFRDLPAARRLAFRELGLAIGLAAVGRLRETIPHGRLSPDSAGALEEIEGAVPLRDEIVRFWLDEGHRGAPSWGEHADINTVMLATALAPAGYLDGAAS